MEIIDSHTHWGPSVTLGTQVTTEELISQAKGYGVERIVIFPFPSQALADEEINERVLTEAGKVRAFIHQIGPERILFGSDNPFGNMRGELQKVLSFQVPDRAKELILSENIRRMLGPGKPLSPLSGNRP